MIFLNSASCAAALVFDCHCVHTLTPRGNRERPEFGIYFKIFEKIQYLMNTLYQSQEDAMQIHAGGVLGQTDGP